jgi:hypothetical protein
VGSGNDALIAGWDLIEASWNTGAEVQGFVAPIDGLYLVTVELTFGGFTWSTGQNLMNVGAKTTGGREIYLQRNEPSSGGGGQRRSYTVSGVLRMAAGEKCTAFMNNGTGSSVTHSDGVSPGNRNSSRLNAVWIGN